MVVMQMKVNGNQFQKISKMYHKRRAQSKENVKSTKNDQVNLSREGNELKRIHEILGQTPNIRLDKVNQLKTAIQQGTYEVKEEKIAEKMIAGHFIDRIV